MKEAYKKCMKEKNTIKIKSYESPCGVLLLGSFGGKLSFIHFLYASFICL